MILINNEGGVSRSGWLAGADQPTPSVRVHSRLLILIDLLGCGDNKFLRRAGPGKHAKQGIIWVGFL